MTSRQKPHVFEDPLSRNVTVRIPWAPSQNYSRTSSKFTPACDHKRQDCVKINAFVTSSNLQVTHGNNLRAVKGERNHSATKPASLCTKSHDCVATS